MSILSLLLCRKEDEESVQQRELEAQRREQKRLEKAEERRYEQFKKDEIVYMEYMNSQLEKEQKELERKRKQKTFVQERANRRASARVQKRKENIRKYLKSQGNSRIKLEASDSHETLETLDESDDFVEAFRNEDMEEIDVDDLPQQQSTPVVVEAEAEYDDEDDLYNCMYQKTIRWCPSVEDEQERRRIHRQQFPTKKGGIARRVRKARKQQQGLESFMDEGDETVEDDDDASFDGRSIGQDSLAQYSIADTTFAEEEDLDKLLSNYRKLVTKSLEGTY